MKISPKLQKHYEQKYKFDYLSTREVISCILIERHGGKLPQQQIDKMIDSAMRQKSFLMRASDLKC